MVDLISFAASALTYGGATLWLLGLLSCCYYRTFRTGILAILVGNLPLGLGLVWPQEVMINAINIGIPLSFLAHSFSPLLTGALLGLILFVLVFILCWSTAPRLTPEEKAALRAQGALHDHRAKAAAKKMAKLTRGKRKNQRASTIHLRVKDNPLSLQESNHPHHTDELDVGLNVAINQLGAPEHALDFNDPAVSSSANDGREPTLSSDLFTRTHQGTPSAPSNLPSSNANPLGIRGARSLAEVQAQIQGRNRSHNPSVDTYGASTQAPLSLKAKRGLAAYDSLHGSSSAPYGQDLDEALSSELSFTESKRSFTSASPYGRTDFALGDHDAPAPGTNNLISKQTSSAALAARPHGAAEEHDLGQINITGTWGDDDDSIFADKGNINDIINEPEADIVTSSQEATSAQQDKRKRVPVTGSRVSSLLNALDDQDSILTNHEPQRSRAKSSKAPFSFAAALSSAQQEHDQDEANTELSAPNAALDSSHDVLAFPNAEPANTSSKLASTLEPKSHLPYGPDDEDMTPDSISSVAENTSASRTTPQTKNLHKLQDLSTSHDPDTDELNEEAQALRRHFQQAGLRSKPEQGEQDNAGLLSNSLKESAPDNDPIWDREEEDDKLSSSYASLASLMPDNIDPEAADEDSEHADEADMRMSFSFNLKPRTRRATALFETGYNNLAINYSFDNGNQPRQETPTPAPHQHAPVYYGDNHSYINQSKFIASLHEDDLAKLLQEHEHDLALKAQEAARWGQDYTHTHAAPSIPAQTMEMLSHSQAQAQAQAEAQEKLRAKAQERNTALGLTAHNHNDHANTPPNSPVPGAAPASLTPDALAASDSYIRAQQVIEIARKVAEEIRAEIKAELKASAPLVLTPATDTNAGASSLSQHNKFATKSVRPQQNQVSGHLQLQPQAQMQAQATYDLQTAAPEQVPILKGAEDLQTKKEAPDDTSFTPLGSNPISLPTSSRPLTSGGVASLSSLANGSPSFNERFRTNRAYSNSDNPNRTNGSRNISGNRSSLSSGNTLPQQVESTNRRASNLAAPASLQAAQAAAQELANNPYRLHEQYTDIGQDEAQKLALLLKNDAVLQQGMMRSGAYEPPAIGGVASQAYPQVNQAAIAALSATTATQSAKDAPATARTTSAAPAALTTLTATAVPAVPAVAPAVPAVSPAVAPAVAAAPVTSSAHTTASSPAYSPAELKPLPQEKEPTTASTLTAAAASVPAPSRASAENKTQPRTKSAKTLKNLARTSRSRPVPITASAPDTDSITAAPTTALASAVNLANAATTSTAVTAANKQDIDTTTGATTGTTANAAASTTTSRSKSSLARPMGANLKSKNRASPASSSQANTKASITATTPTAIPTPSAPATALSRASEASQAKSAANLSSAEPSTTIAKPAHSLKKHLRKSGATSTPAAPATTTSPRATNAVKAAVAPVAPTATLTTAAAPANSTAWTSAGNRAMTTATPQSRPQNTPAVLASLSKAQPSGAKPTPAPSTTATASPALSRTATQNPVTSGDATTKRKDHGSATAGAITGSDARASTGTSAGSSLKKASLARSVKELMHGRKVKSEEKEAKAGNQTSASQININTASTPGTAVPSQAQLAQSQAKLAPNQAKLAPSQTTIAPSQAPRSTSSLKRRR